jgi:hypothetical protein
VLRRRLAGVARSQAPGLGFEHETDLHVAGSKANSTTRPSRRLGRRRGHHGRRGGRRGAGERQEVLRFGET